jgi:folylpolyglutamate synthase/dihydropteroate synthase
LDGPAVEHGLAQMVYRARMEPRHLRGAPVLLDAAHNADSLRWLAEVLKARYAGKRLPLLFGCQATRDPADMLAPLACCVSSVTPIAIPVLRPCPTGRIAQAAGQLGLDVSQPPGVELQEADADIPIGNVTELDPPDNSTHWLQALEHALGLAREGTPLVICGSIYYLGEILRIAKGPATAPAETGP